MRGAVAFKPKFLKSLESYFNLFTSNTARTKNQFLIITRRTPQTEKQTFDESNIFALLKQS